MKIPMAILVGLMILYPLTLFAAPRSIEMNMYSGSKYIDNTSRINVNNILMFVTNHGNFGRDLNDVFGYDAGTFFPFNIEENIENGLLDNYCLYAAGPWIAGKVNGQVRIVIAEYSDEYVPGPMAGGTFLPDNPEFKVYKLYKDSLESNPNADYLSWPVDQGAPVDAENKPIMLGDQMLWAVYNDADPIQHTNDAGSTDPLGIEIQHTFWAFDGPFSDPDASSIYINYKMYNKGGNTITDCYFSFWVDPDLGGAGDDLVGCDTLNDIIFCYNSTNNDQQYGSAPPALGFKIIYGPMVPAPGQCAYFDGKCLPGTRNLKMTSFIKYTNGTDPYNAIQSYNYIRGLNRDGTTYIYDGNPTTYFCSGDPVAGTGNLDVSPADRRMMASFGPFTFHPGDSQFVMIKMAVGPGTDRLSSITELKNILNATSRYSYCAGDANGDGFCNVGDIVSLVYHIYHGGPEPLPFLAGDANCDYEINAGDVVYLMNYIFKHGPYVSYCE